MQLKDYEKVESTNIDFKEEVEYKKPKSWLNTVSAFANSNGGILLFGVRDVDREPIGLKNVIKDSEKISELINDKITPLPRYELKTFKEKNKEENNKQDTIVNTNEGVIKDQEVEGLKMTITSLIYENGISTLITEVSNNTGIDYNLNEFNITVKGANGNVITTLKG